MHPGIRVGAGYPRRRRRRSRPGRANAGMRGSRARGRGSRARTSSRGPSRRACGWRRRRQGQTQPRMRGRRAGANERRRAICCYRCLCSIPSTLGRANAGTRRSPGCAPGSRARTGNRAPSMRPCGWRTRSQAQRLLPMMKSRRAGAKMRRGLGSRPRTLGTMYARTRRSSGSALGSRARIGSREPSMRLCGCLGGWER